MTALVGPSGSGKTSCVSLLKRLYEPQEGQILLDGEPLHHYEHKYFHQKVQLPRWKEALIAAANTFNSRVLNFFYFMSFFAVVRE